MEILLRRIKKAIVLKYIAQGFSGTCDLVSWWLFWEVKCFWQVLLSLKWVLWYLVVGWRWLSASAPTKKKFIFLCYSWAEEGERIIKKLIG